VHRCITSEPIEYDKVINDPSMEKGDDDKHTSIITMSIVFAAFIISPLTECLGSVLELNVCKNK